MHKQTDKERRKERKKKEKKLKWKSTLFLFHTTSQEFSYISTAEPISGVSSALSSEWGKDIKVTGNKFKCIKEISQVYNCKEGFAHDE